MIAVPLNEGSLEKLSKIAERRYYDWFQRESRPEWNRRLAEARSQKASIGGRALLPIFESRRNFCPATRLSRSLLMRPLRARATVRQCCQSSGSTTSENAL